MEDNFNYFQQELGFLRRSVEKFGSAYPSVAAELKLSAGRSADPHVEQLLQSFAYLTGQLRFDLEQQRDQIPNQLLHSLYPNLMRSLPSMTVLEANVETDGANFVNGFVLEKGRQFVAQAKSSWGTEPVNCQFQCCYHTPLWPFEIGKVKVSPKNYYPFLDYRKDTQAVLSIAIKSVGMDPIYEYPLEQLRFYINDSQLRVQLYQLLTEKLVGVAIKVGEQVITLDKGKLEWLGFADDENVLPDDEGSQRAYRLLQEYFAFLHKFYFFDVTGLNKQQLEILNVTDHFELLLLLNESGSAISVAQDSFSLNSFPAINLYHKTFKPVQLNQTEFEYRLLADEKQYLQAEVHSITGMRSITFDGLSRPVNPWLGSQLNPAAGQYYISRLVPLLHPGEAGCDTMLSLYEPDLQPSQPVDQTISVTGWCNNRRLPEALRIGDTLQPVGTGPMLNAKVIEQPSRFKSASLDGENSIKLLSQLTLNLYALGEGEDRLALLKQLLYLYCDSKAPSHIRQLEGISGMKTEALVKRIGNEAWRGHCRGTRITVNIDENCFSDGSNPLLLGEVLSVFFGLYTTLNHFVQLQLCSHQQEGVWKQWQPRIGEQVIL